MATITHATTMATPRRRVRGLTITLVALMRAKLTLGAGAFYALFIGLLVGGLYPSMTKFNLDAYLSSSTMVSMLGTGTIKHLSGFTALMGIEFYSAFYGLIFGGIVAYVAGAALPATIDNGTLDLALARPVSRTRYYLEMWLSALLGCLILSAVTLISIWLGSLFVKEANLDWQWLMNTQLLELAFFVCAAGVGVFFGSFINSSRASGGAALGIIALAYLMNTVGGISDKLDWMLKIEPLHYVQAIQALLQHDFTWWYPLVLVGAGLLLGVAGLVIFNRRDLPTT